VLVLYRKDHEFALDHLIPRQGAAAADFDLVIAAQPFRARSSAEFKVNRVLAPLAQSLGESGRLVVVQSTGQDPGMEIIRSLWPDEEPFTTPRKSLLTKLAAALDGFTFEGTDDDDSLFRYEMHALPEDVEGHIGTSMLLAAWNAAVYVAQIDSHRANEVLKSGGYLDATEDVLHRHGRLWFQDESFVVTPTAGP
jgi:hypothetical protein